METFSQRCKKAWKNVTEYEEIQNGKRGRDTEIDEPSSGASGK